MCLQRSTRMQFQIRARTPPWVHCLLTKQTWRKFALTESPKSVPPLCWHSAGFKEFASFSFKLKNPLQHLPARLVSGAEPTVHCLWKLLVKSRCLLLVETRLFERRRWRKKNAHCKNKQTTKSLITEKRWRVDVEGNCLDQYHPCDVKTLSCVG